MGLGCNGIIHVLIEPLEASDDLNPIDLLKKALELRQVSIIATVFSLNNPRQAQVGIVAIYKEGASLIRHSLIGSPLMPDLEEGKEYAETHKHSVIMSYPHYQAGVFFEYSEATLIATQTSSGKGIFACRYEDTLSVPVLFDKKYFDEILNLDGSIGAKKLIFQYPDDRDTVYFPKGKIDIDTLEDNKMLTGEN